MATHDKILTEEFSLEDIRGTIGETSLYIKDSNGNWNEYSYYEFFKIVKKQNQISEFEISLPNIEASDKLIVKEFAEVLFLSENNLILKGRIQKVTYKTAYSCNVTGFGMEATLLDKEFNELSNTTATWNDSKRAQYTNISAQTIAKELLSSNSDGISPFIMDFDNSGLFSSDFGDISIRFEYANRLKALAALTESLVNPTYQVNYDWWVSSSSADDYSSNRFHLAPLRPSVVKATSVIATYDNKNVDVSGQTTNNQDLAFSSDGTKMYTTNSLDIYQYTLSTPWDVSTATYSGKKLDVSYTGISTGIFFKSDGTELYFTDAGNHYVHQYTLSTPWDVDSGTFTSSKDVSGQCGSNTEKIYISPDGTNMYIHCTGTTYQYTLSTPWNISTATYSGKNLVLGLSSFYFSSDGTKIYIISGGYVKQYSLTTAWDISTAIDDSKNVDISDEDSNPKGMHIGDGDEKMYIMGDQNDTVFQYSLISRETFAITGDSANCTQTNFEKDVTNLANKVDVLGYGDGINQIHTSTYNASPTYSILASEITSSSTTITLSDASDFNSSGTIRIMEEQITYTGKSGNDLTGCTRGANSTTARVHKKGCYVEKYVAIASAETDSSINEYGLMDYSVTDRSILDLPTAELIASKILLEKMTPIVSIRITPNEPMQVAGEREIGELVTVEDVESGISGDYRIVGMTYTSDYGYLQMELELSNKTLTFIEQMKSSKEEAEKLSKYMQGSTNIYAINESENCDDTHPLNLRFYLPSEAIAVNKVLLSFKLSDFRAYSTSSESESAHTHDITIGDESNAPDSGVGQTIALLGFTGTNLYSSYGSGVVSSTSVGSAHSHGIIYGIEEEILTDQSVDLSVGSEGSESAVDTYTTNQIDIDITDKVRDVGKGNWINIKFEANKRMRIEANAYIQIFIRST